MLHIDGRALVRLVFRCFAVEMQGADPLRFLYFFYRLDKKMRVRDPALSEGWGHIVTPLSIESKILKK